jgi:hypothetical protein
MPLPLTHLPAGGAFFFHRYEMRRSGKFEIRNAEFGIRNSELEKLLPRALEEPNSIRILRGIRPPTRKRASDYQENYIVLGLKTFPSTADRRKRSPRSSDVSA